MISMSLFYVWGIRRFHEGTILVWVGNELGDAKILSRGYTSDFLLALVMRLFFHIFTFSHFQIEGHANRILEET